MVLNILLVCECLYDQVMVDKIIHTLCMYLCCTDISTCCFDVFTVYEYVHGL